MGALCGKCTAENVNSLADVISKELPMIKGDSARAAALAILAASSNGVNAINYNRIPSKLIATENLTPINVYEVQVSLQPKTLVDQMNAMQIPNLIAVQPRTLISSSEQTPQILKLGGSIFAKDTEQVILDGTIQDMKKSSSNAKAKTKGIDPEGNVYTDDNALIDSMSRILGFRLEVQRVDLLKGPNTLSIRVEYGGTPVLDSSYTMTNPNTMSQLVALMAMPEQIATADWDGDHVIVKTQPDARRWQIDIPQAKNIKIEVSVSNLQARIYPIIVCRDSYNRFIKATVAGKLPELPAAFLQ